MVISCGAFIGIQPRDDIRCILDLIHHILDNAKTFIVIGTYCLPRSTEFINKLREISTKVEAFVLVYGKEEHISYVHYLSKIIAFKPIIYVPYHHARYIICDHGVYISSANFTHKDLFYNIESYSTACRSSACGIELRNLSHLNTIFEYAAKNLEEILTRFRRGECSWLKAQIQSVVRSLDDLILSLHAYLKSSVKVIDEEFVIDKAKQLHELVADLFSVIVNTPLAKLHPAVKLFAERIRRIVKTCNNIVWKFSEQAALGKVSRNTQQRDELRLFVAKAISRLELLKSFLQGTLDNVEYCFYLMRKYLDTVRLEQQIGMLNLVRDRLASLTS